MRFVGSNRRKIVEYTRTYIGTFSIYNQGKLSQEEIEQRNCFRLDDVVKSRMLEVRAMVQPMREDVVLPHVRPCVLHSMQITWKPTDSKHTIMQIFTKIIVELCREASLMEPPIWDAARRNCSGAMRKGNILMDFENYMVHPQPPMYRAKFFTNQWRKTISHGDDYRGGGWYNDMGNKTMDRLMRQSIESYSLLDQLRKIDHSPEVGEWIDSMADLSIEHRADVMEGLHFLTMTMCTDHEFLFAGDILIFSRRANVQRVKELSNLYFSICTQRFGCVTEVTPQCYTRSAAGRIDAQTMSARSYAFMEYKWLDYYTPVKDYEWDILKASVRGTMGSALYDALTSDEQEIRKLAVAKEAEADEYVFGHPGEFYSETIIDYTNRRLRTELNQNRCKELHRELRAFLHSCIQGVKTTVHTSDKEPSASYFSEKVENPGGIRPWKEIRPDKVRCGNAEGTLVPQEVENGCIKTVKRWFYNIEEEQEAEMIAYAQWMYNAHWPVDRKIPEFHEITKERIEELAQLVFEMYEVHKNKDKNYKENQKQSYQSWQQSASSWTPQQWKSSSYKNDGTRWYPK